MVAERIMDGEEIVVLNAEAIVITGVKEQVFADFKAKVDRGDTTKRKGPFYPRRADLLFKRCVRGMIPWTTRPEQACRKITGKYTTLGAVSKFLGSNVR